MNNPKKLHPYNRHPLSSPGYANYKSEIDILGTRSTKNPMSLLIPCLNMTCCLFGLYVNQLVKELASLNPSGLETWIISFPDYCCTNRAFTCYLYYLPPLGDPLNADTECKSSVVSKLFLPLLPPAFLHFFPLFLPLLTKTGLQR